MNAINQVYRVRTKPLMKHNRHNAKQGSLVVIDYKWEDGTYTGYAISDNREVQGYYAFRPCDLSRLEFHEEINN